MARNKIALIGGGQIDHFAHLAGLKELGDIVIFVMVTVFRKAGMDLLQSSPVSHFVTA